MHHSNSAECAIRTFKDHFLTILAGTAPTFPSDRWDLLLPQAKLTLNLLCSTPGDKHASAWEALFGAYNFDATPMAPAGCAIHIHNKASIRLHWTRPQTLPVLEGARKRIQRTHDQQCGQI